MRACRSDRREGLFLHPAKRCVKPGPSCITAGTIRCDELVISLRIIRVHQMMRDHRGRRRLLQQAAAGCRGDRRCSRDVAIDGRQRSVWILQRVTVTR